MKVIHTNAALHECLQQQSSIGFVPTMGALHKGHLSLVERSKKENQTTVVSIFVNPTQFNDKGDLARYPRNLNQDIALLEQVGCDLIYAPNEAEVYPQKDTRQFDFGLLEQVMEGKHRPGHFNGVAQVVSRLFDLVKPQRAYFGEKDFQQLAIIRAMVQQFNLAVNIIPCPIIREADGLAMSSRNQLLTPSQRKAAARIARTLFAAVDKVCTTNLSELKQFVITEINSEPELQVEYFEVVDALSLQSVQSLDEVCAKQACIAVQAGKIRLIDNVRL
ncbi:MAG: pantoate--beta-alanine ligase [Bacteroidales bacterium]